MLIKKKMRVETLPIVENLYSELDDLYLNLKRYSNLSGALDNTRDASSVEPLFERNMFL